MSIRELLEHRFWTNLMVPFVNLLRVLAVVTAAWEFTIGEKSRISASFLRVDVRDKVGLNCELWFDSGRLDIFILKTFAKRKGQNNATAVNLLNSDSLKVGVFFADPNLDPLCICQSDAASFCENYAEYYFDAKHLEVIKFLVPFFQKKPF